MATEKEEQKKEDKTKSSVINAPTDGYYLLSGYNHKKLHKIDSETSKEKKDMNIESMEPVANRLIYAGSDTKKATDMHGSLFITNSVGLIHSIAVDEKTFEVKPKAAYTGTTVDTISLKEKSQIIIPPPEIVCGYMDNKDWITDFSDKMHEIISSSSGNSDASKFGAPLELEKIPLSYLRKPKPLSKEQQKQQRELEKKRKQEQEAADKSQQCVIVSKYKDIKDDDADYRAWYNEILSGKDPNSVFINAYVLQKVRAIFFIFTIDILGKETEIKIYNSNNELFKETKLTQAKFEGGGKSKYIKYIVPVIGNDKTLPKGRYTLTIEHPFGTSSDLPDRTKHWNNRILYSKNNEYTLAFNVTFPLNTLAGEFEMACADPITLEEALVQQYPQYYYYLLTEYLKEEKAETAKEDSNAAKAAKAIEPYFNYWKLSREVASFSTDILGLELEDIPVAKGKSDSDGESKGKRINKLELFSTIAKFMHDTFKKSEHPELSASIDTVFQIKDTIDKWGDLRKSANELLQLMDEAQGVENAADNTRKMGKAFSELFARRGEAIEIGTKVNFVEKAKDAWFTKKAWFGDPNDLELVEEHANRLASSFGISQKAWNFVGKSLDVIDLGVSGYEFYKKVDALFKAAKDVENAVDDFEDLTGQYLTFLGMDDPYLCEYDLEIRFRFSHPLEGGELTVEDILEEDGKKYDNASKLKKFAEIVKKNKEIVIIQGHTDKVDTDEYNIALSERRANAVVKKLVSDYGIDEKRFRAVGFGESRVVVDTEGPEQRNRRVVAIVPQYQDLAPACRKGINILEKNRYRTVMQELKYYEAIVTLIDAAVDLALAVASMVPITAIAANALALAKSAVDSIKSVDSLMYGSSGQKFMAELVYGGKMRQDLLFESYANQTLLRKSIISNSKGDTVTRIPSLPENTKSTIQLRLRSEAIGGLLRLIIRASLTTGKDRAAFEKKLSEDYKIDAYIQNFILTDGWTMPLKPPIAFSMDEFWLYAINDLSMNPVDARKGFGLDKDGYFIEKFVKDAATVVSYISLSPGTKLLVDYGYDYIDTGFSGKGAVAKQSYVMSRLACVPEHVNASFHDHYPIHHLVADNVFDMASGLNPDFSALDKDIYEFTGIYGLVEQSDKSTKWVSIAQIEEDHYKQQKAKNASTAKDPVCVKSIATVEGDSINQETTAAKVVSQSFKNSIVGAPLQAADHLKNSVRYRSVKEYSPLMPVKIVIIFKNTKDNDDNSMVNRLCPVSLQVHRVKTWGNLNGPVYKTVARKLAKGDLDNLDFTEKQIKHILDNEMYGCIIEPFYQLGTVTFAGIKPTEKYSKNNEVEEDYKDGDLSNMRHFFKCKVGDNDSTVKNIPIHTYNYWKDINPSSQMHTRHKDCWFPVVSTEFENEIHTTLVNDTTHKNLFNYSFFSANTTAGHKNNFPRFFDEYTTLADSTPKLDARVYVRVGGKGKFRSTIIDNYKEKNYSEQTNLHKEVLTFDSSFNWRKTPVEFITTICCEDPQFKYYRYQAKQDFTQIQCAANLINTELSDATGPQISQKQEDTVVYLGEVKCFKVNRKYIQEFIDLNIYSGPINDHQKESLNDILERSDNLRELLKSQAIANKANTVICYHFTPYEPSLANKKISPLMKELMSPPRFTTLEKGAVIKIDQGYMYDYDRITQTYGLHDFINTVPPSHFNKPQSTYQLFAFYKAPTYNHPLTGEEIKCIRPFDDVVGNLNPFGNNYYSYRVDDIMTTGNSSGGKALNALCPEMKFPAENAVKDLKPSSKFLSSKLWKNKHKDWQTEIKDWIENNITDTEGAKKLFENMKAEEQQKRDKAIGDIVKHLKMSTDLPENKVSEYIDALPYLISNEEIMSAPSKIKAMSTKELKQHVDETIETKKKFIKTYNKGVTLYKEGREYIVNEGTKYLSNLFKGGNKEGK